MCNLVAPLVLLIVFISLQLTPVIQAQRARSVASIEEYYWRRYYGLVPSDALLGGVDEKGKNIYIGQLTLEARYNRLISPIHTIPATVKPGIRFLQGAYGGNTVNGTRFSNQLVLCSNYAYYYIWLSPENVASIRCRYVIGGIEDNVELFIGRTKQGNETVIGKVFSETERHTSGLIVPYNNAERVYENYTILTVCYR